MKNIYFVGKAGAGKTYSANYIKEKYGYKTAKFAYPIYDIARNYFNMTTKNRKLLQIIGTDAGRRNIDSNIWINRMVEDLRIVSMVEDIYNYPKTYYVSDDVRFKNEHESLKKAGWVGLYLNVPEDMRIKRLIGRDGNAQIETLGHESEKEIDSFTNELIKIDSTGSLQDLYNNIDNFIKKL